MGELKELAVEKKDGLLWSPVQMLKRVVKELEAGRDVAGSAVVVLLDDQEEGYVVSAYVAGLTTSQVVALLEFAKIKVMTQWAKED